MIILKLHFLKVPSGILNWEEQRDIMLMIGGASPVGTPISIQILPRRRKFDIFTTLL